MSENLLAVLIGLVFLITLIQEFQIACVRGAIRDVLGMVDLQQELIILLHAKRTAKRYVNSGGAWVSEEQP